MQNMIDLRKTPELPPPPKELPASNGGNSQPEIADAFFIWNALEYEAKAYGKNWYIGAGAVTMLLILIAMFTENYFFLAFTMLSFFVVVLFAKRPPRELTFAITKEGVYVGRNVWTWSTLKSFWVFEGFKRKELSLETDKTITPFVRIPLHGIEIEKLREVIKKFIPEKEHQELIADEIGRKLGF